MIENIGVKSVTVSMYLYRRIQLVHDSIRMHEKSWC